jgi:RNA recognition motif-containing protein
MTISVSNIHYEATEKELKYLFAEYGSVKRVDYAVNPDTGRPSGFASVEMETEAEEEAAIKALDGATWMDRSLQVNKARPSGGSRPPRGSFGGSRPPRGSFG